MAPRGTCRSLRGAPNEPAHDADRKPPGAGNAGPDSGLRQRHAALALVLAAAVLVAGLAVTVLNSAQRDAAWGEVARRLAHEVKNPLTPIQLAAERLRRRFLGRLPADVSELLDRATHTIVSQVEALKTMVNAFGDYARPPQLTTRPVALHALIDEVLDLYASDQRLSLPGSSWMASR